MEQNWGNQCTMFCKLYLPEKAKKSDPSIVAVKRREYTLLMAAID